MHHELFGELQYEPGDEFWAGFVRLRQFAAFGEPRYEDEDERKRRDEGILPIAIWASGSGPTVPQEAAYRFLRDNEADVFRAVLEALFESYKAYTDAPSPLSPLWNWLGGLLGVKPIESPEGLNTEAGFTDVEVAREHINGLAYLLFDVTCAWEPEHGMIVVYHKDRPATWTTVDALELESDG
ncbi:MAG: hypothetical protein L0Y72_26625 [Gemmataceae bacterium]|nr:hypothetical protein [Gemmataceae bacterium]